MLRVIEFRLQHPTIDQNRLGNGRRRILDRSYVMTESAARKIRPHLSGHLPLRFVRIGGEKHRVLQFFTGPKLLA